MATTLPLPEGAAAPSAGILRNLSAINFDTSIPAGEKRAITYSFVLDMMPQDVHLNLLAVISKPSGQVFQVLAHNGTASIVEAPTSIFDPQVYVATLPAPPPPRAPPGPLARPSLAPRLAPISVSLLADPNSLNEVLTR